MSGPIRQLESSRTAKESGHLEVTVDRHSAVPLYIQISEQFIAAIADGELSPGARLQNEVALAQQLSVSRPTVRRALERLVNKGLVLRRRGSGTVVVPQRVTRRSQVASLFDDLFAAGRNPSTRVLSINQVPADAGAAASLRVPPGDMITVLERLRFADDLPLAVMVNRLPERYGDFEAGDLETFGLYALLKRRGAKPQLTTQSISARPATAREAHLMEVDGTATVLTVLATSFDASGVCIEVGAHAYLADRYALDISVIGGA